MNDDRTKHYWRAMYPGGVRPGTDRSATANLRAVMAVADAEQEALRQECRDRECTEQDVRARLADAENTLAKVRAVADEWDDQYCDEWALDDLRAALGGTS